MDVYPEIELSKEQHNAIEVLRNKSFPEHQVARSHYKKLPYIRALKYKDDQLVGYIELDYRVVSVGDEIYKVLGVSDFCVDLRFQRQGISNAMLYKLSEYASTKDVDFIILISDLDDFYAANGYLRLNALSPWLLIHEHKNYGIVI